MSRKEREKKSLQPQERERNESCYSPWVDLGVLIVQAEAPLWLSSHRKTAPYSKPDRHRWEGHTSSGQDRRCLQGTLQRAVMGEAERALHRAPQLFLCFKYNFILLRK